MLTGTELEIAKIAGPSVARAIGDPAKRAAMKAYATRGLKKELYDGTTPDQIEQALRALRPEQASAVTEFLRSTEFAHIAAELANHEILNICGKRAADLHTAAKEQIQLLLTIQAQLDHGESDALGDLIFASLSTVIGHISEQVSRSLPAATKAAMVKTCASQIASAMRNCEILGSISQLSTIQTSKEQLRTQVGNLYGTMRLPHAGTTRKVPYDKLYVQPRLEIQSDEPTTSRLTETVGELLESFVRVVILGDPGGGKSTLSLKLAFDTARSVNPTNPTVPFLIVLREYATELTHGPKSIVEYLYDICGMPLSVAMPSGSIEYMLLNGYALVIFDGLDELLDTSLRRKVVETVEAFAYMYPTAQILVTSRRLGYSDAPLDSDLFKPVSLREFDQPQVTKYVSNWFDLDDSVAPASKRELKRTFQKDSEFVSDLRVNPLMLSLMCGIYSSEHYIPRNRPDVYEKCALLLFDRWDKQRGIASDLAFDAHVQSAMRALALWMYPQQAGQAGIPRTKLVDFMTSYLLEKRFDSQEEAENAASGFIDYCKGRAWVLTDVGAELYGFTHRTFLEYFAASQIVRLNPGPEQLYTFLAPKIISGGWEVVAQLALQIGNKTVEDCADDFLERLCETINSSSGGGESLHLMQFAAQSLTYVVPRAAVLRGVVSQVVRQFLAGSPSDPKSEVPVYALLSAAPENWPLISKYLYEELVSALVADAANERALWLGILPDVLASGGGALRTNYGGSSQQAEFWAEEAQSRRLQLSEWITALSMVRAWPAVNMVEHGELSIDEALARFGAVALLSDSIDRPVNVRWQAFVDRMILTLGQSADRFSLAMSVDRIDQVRRALLSASLPISVELPKPTASVLPWLSARLQAGMIEDAAFASVMFFSFVLAGGAEDLGEEMPRRRSAAQAGHHPAVDVLNTLVLGSNSERAQQLEAMTGKGRGRGDGDLVDCARELDGREGVACTAACC